MEKFSNFLSNHKTAIGMSAVVGVAVVKIYYLMKDRVKIQNG